jgi:hypothetical protein
LKTRHYITIFLLISFLYLWDSFFNISLDSKKNLLFLFLLILSIIIYFFTPKIRQFFLISLTTVFLFDVSFNFFLQDYFPVIKIKPIIKNSVQKSTLYLDNWPYYKFKPNIIAQTYGDRGSDCIYKWKTDKLGFKNLEVKKNYNFISLGDSYVEGMCSSIDETFSYYLNKKNIYTYNLGVQGWSDKQAISALKIIDNEKIDYNGIIFGYLADRFDREKNFLNNPEPAGGLLKIIKTESRIGKSYFASREIIQKLFKFNDFNWSTQFTLTNSKAYLSKQTAIKVKEKYKDLKIPLNYIPPIVQWSEIANIDHNNNELIDVSNEAIKKIAIRMKIENRKFIIFVFPLRSDVLGHIIYNKGYICSTDYYEAVKRVRKNLIGTDAIILDFFEASVELTEKWIKTQDYDDFIWKYKDPHYSKVGNKLVSNIIEDFLINGNKGSLEYLKNCI